MPEMPDWWNNLPLVAQIALWVVGCLAALIAAFAFMEEIATWGDD